MKLKLALIAASLIFCGGRAQGDGVASAPATTIAPPASAPAVTGPVRVPILMKWEKGTAFFMDINTLVDSNQLIAKAGVKVWQKVSSSYSARYQVENVVDGVMTIRVSIAGARFEVESAAGKSKGDSSDPAGKSVWDKICAGVVGNGFTMDIDKFGILKKITGAKEFAETTADEMAKDGTMQRAAALTQVATLYNDNTLAQNFGLMFRVFPGGPAAVNDFWKLQLPPQFGQMTGSNLSYTVKSINNNIAELAVDGIVVSPDGGVAGKSGTMSTLTKIGGTETGKITVDLATGAFLFFQTDVDTTGIVSITDAAGKFMDDGYVRTHTVTTMKMKTAK